MADLCAVGTHPVHNSNIIDTKSRGDGLTQLTIGGKSAYFGKSEVSMIEGMRLHGWTVSIHDSAEACLEHIKRHAATQD